MRDAVREHLMGSGDDDIEHFFLLFRYFFFTYWPLGYSQCHPLYSDQLWVYWPGPSVVHSR